MESILKNMLALFETVTVGVCVLQVQHALCFGIGD